MLFRMQTLHSTTLTGQRGVEVLDEKRGAVGKSAQRLVHTDNRLDLQPDRTHACKRKHAQTTIHAHTRFVILGRPTAA